MISLRFLTLLGACTTLNLSAQSQQPAPDAQPCALCGTTASEWIEGITIQGLSSFFLDPPGGGVGGCAGSMVLDAYLGYLKKGAYHSFSLTPGFSGAPQSEYWKIWIDLNADGDFDDPGDLVYASGSGSATTVSGSFLIPLTAITGPTAIRVAMRRGSPPPDCGNYTNGQVLDYKPVYIDECDISFTNACAREYIQHVIINSINNASGCGTSGYQDFTNISTILNAGNANPVQLTPGFFGAGQHPERWLIWIDFNKDYDFDDPGEMVFDSGPFGTSGPTSGNMTIPAGAPSVTTRMRIKMIPTDVNTVTLNPCDPVPDFWGIGVPDQYGEAEDYTVIIEGATLQVTPGGNPETLLKEVFIGGNCFDVTNVTYSGNGGQIGTFSHGLTNIGFNNGIIIATGDCSVAVGPNDQDGASAGYGFSTPDSNLTQLSGSSANFDLASLEFDFTPTKTPLTFQYVFASEEYCEYVGSQFNDVFGFFISGPGISGPFDGATNIASLGPGTYVGINNINHISNSGLYTNNTPDGGQLCGQTASNAPATNEVQFDGFTKKLTAVANVIPCQTYHIKLKICDIGDGIFDSAVFLNAGSFDDSGNASVTWIVNGNPDATETYEGCGTVQLLFDRIGGDLGAPLVVSYQILGTATNGADYIGVPFSVVIPAGQDQLLIPVNIISDLIAEGAETISIKLNNTCSCLNPEETLTILDLPQLQAIPDTVTICGAGAATVGVTPTSGVEPFSYNWSVPGNTGPTITQFVNTSQNYLVTITDACGRTIVRTARVIVTDPPNAQLLPPAPQICPGGNALLNVNFNGNGPFTIEYILNGFPQTPITNISNDLYTFSVYAPGLYQLTAVSDVNGCQGSGSGALLVTVSTLALTGVVTNVNCNGQNNSSINTTVLGGQGPYNYAWAGPQNIPANTQDPTGLQSGVYTVTVTDDFGCSDQQQFTIAAPSAIALSIVQVQSANCANPTGGNIDLNVSGGTPDYNYSWAPGGYTVQDPMGLAPGNYTVTVTDTNGCTKTTTVAVPGDFIAPLAVIAAPGTISCTSPTVTLHGTGSSTGAGFTYNWTTTNGVIVSGAGTLNPVVSMAGTYTLVVTNTTNGCTAANTVQVNGNVIPPIANGGPDKTLTCAITNAMLDGSGSSQGPNFSYQWMASNGGNITGGANTPNPTVSAAGTYTLVVTNTINACTATDVVIVNGIQNTLSISTIVAGNTITALASGGTGTLQYSLDGVNFQFGNQFFNVPCGDYTVTVKDANDCTATSSPVTVNVLTGNVQTTEILCHGGTATIFVTATCGTPPFLYKLGDSPFQSTSAFTGVAAGTYFASVLDASGATIVIGPFTISQPAPMGVAATVNCNDATLAFSGGTPPYESNPADLQNLPNGTYQVTATDSHGCTAVTAFTVDAPPLGVSYTTHNVPCYGDNTGSITAMGLGGCPPYTYSLSGSPYQASDSFSNLAAGSYPLSIKDSEGNLSPTPFVTVFQPPILSLTADTTCNIIIANTAGGIPPYQYSLNGGPQQSGGTFPDLEPGTYTVVSTDTNGCTAIETDLVIVCSIGTVEPAEAWGLTISPNPSAGLFVLTLQNAPDVLRAELFDVTGRLLQSLRLEPVDGQLTTTLNLQNFPSGTYILQLTDGKNWGGVRLSKVGGN